ncbi:MAG TPA: GspMb/PilO family protein [Pyrinomonadaceae bacterium]|nr:GspMb/PilO family protein [Pyrinomonadaceae bacterium]
MSEERATQQSVRSRRVQIRTRVDKFRQARQRSVLGVAEIIGLAASAVLLLAVIVVYFYFYVPAGGRLDAAQLDRGRQREKLSQLQKTMEVGGTAQDAIAKINQSLDDFENGRLTTRAEGRISLYNTLIQLIRSNNLRNTSGPVYNYLESKTPGQQQAAAARTVSSRWQSLYPGIAVTVTVEGQYANVRHFVRDIESSNQFIIINAVELERASDAGQVVTEGETAGPRNTLVSLRLDMAAYYRRDAGGVEVLTEQQPAGETR